MNHAGKKWDTFLFRGSDSKLRGQKLVKAPDILTVDCGERYSKRSRTIAKPEQKHNYTNAMFKLFNMFLSFCVRVCESIISAIERITIIECIYFKINVR